MLNFTQTNRELRFARSLFLILLFLSVNVFGQTPKFKVLAFYNGTYDAAHINFVAEARQWYPQLAAHHTTISGAGAAGFRKKGS